MDNKQLFFEWLKSLPVWLRAIVLILVASFVLIASMSFVACGTMTSATIRNIHPNTATSITISNNTTMDTDVTTSATPEINL